MEADTRIKISRCPSGEIAELQVAVIQGGSARRGACPTTRPDAAFSLSKPCDTSTQFQLPTLADGQQLLFWFQRDQGRTAYCETCAEGSRSNVEGLCSLQGPPACLAKEICGNGADDNCDGQIDEGCPSVTEPVLEPSVEVSTEPRDEPSAELVMESRKEPITVSDEASVDMPDSGASDGGIPEQMAGEFSSDAGEAADGEPRSESANEVRPERLCEAGPLGSTGQAERCGALSEQAGESSTQEQSSGTEQTSTRCQSATDCNGNPCIDSQCSVASALCSADSQCQASERCLQGGCHQVASLCGSDQDCPNQQTCERGVCMICVGGVNCQLPGPCDPDDPTSCSTGFTCTIKACLRQCQSTGTPAGTCPQLPRMLCYPHAGQSTNLCQTGCVDATQCPQQFSCQVDPVSGVGVCLRM